MADTREPTEDDGLASADRPRALALIFRRHGRPNVHPTEPTRVEIARLRTATIELWEVIAWLPLTSEFLAWRRDSNLDGRLKAKAIAAEDSGGCLGTPIPFADRWTVEPAADDAEGGPAAPSPEETFLRDLDLGLTTPNSVQLAKYGKPPRPTG